MAIVKYTGCSFEGCEKPHRRNGFCDGHSAQAAKGKPLTPLKAYQIRERGLPCIVCGSLEYKINNTQFCTGACQYLYRVFNGNVPTTYNCGKCGVEESYEREDKKRRPSSVRLCGRCQRRKQLTKFIEPLAERDGTDCQICFEPVDITLRGRTDLSVSVDHIVPVSYGGTEELNNLRLSHLACNRRRSNAVQLNELKGADAL